jgi:hypothetical protein
MSAVGVRLSAERAALGRDAVRIVCTADGTRRECRLLDASSKRLFIESFVPLVRGVEVALELHMPGGRQIRTNGVVSYHQIRVGFVVDIEDLPARDHEDIVKAAA